MLVKAARSGALYHYPTMYILPDCSAGYTKIPGPPSFKLNNEIFIQCLLVELIV